MSKLVWIPEKGDQYFFVNFKNESVGAKVVTSDQDRVLYTYLVQGNCFRSFDEAVEHCVKLKAKLAIMKWMSKQEDCYGGYCVDEYISPVNTDDIDGYYNNEVDAYVEWGNFPLLDKEQAEQLVKDLPNELKEYLK